MLNLERTNLVLQLLEENDSVTVKQLSKVFDVSEVTSRKILNEMDSKGLLKRTRGGAVNIDYPVIERDEDYKEKLNVSEKKSIAKKAYELINDHENLFIDAGSTTLELVRLIKYGTKRNITIITNALNIAYELRASYDIEVIFIGGVLRHKIMSCVGGIAENIINDFNFDKLFLGINSIDLKFGISTPNLYEAQIKKKMIQSSQKSILLCDSTKFGLKSMSRICSIEDIDLIITDNKLKNKYINGLKEMGIKYILT
ncbi:MAG: DeoR/GlpR family DNA-binding transcription regulator [Miniphocaeibacter sp.]|uniref:DeoR/GlpR family DNA-binding transcription regulator n=1 Tax=Miniphocaeibacter sp. TaxID=3100973 RepID=UPI003BAF93EB